MKYEVDQWMKRTVVSFSLWGGERTGVWESGGLVGLWLLVWGSQCGVASTVLFLSFAPSLHLFLFFSLLPSPSPSTRLLWQLCCRGNTATGLAVLPRRPVCSLCPRPCRGNKRCWLNITNQCCCFSFPLLLLQKHLHSTRLLFTCICLGFYSKSDVPATET